MAQLMKEMSESKIWSSLGSVSHLLFDTDPLLPQEICQEGTGPRASLQSW